MSAPHSLTRPRVAPLHALLLCISIVLTSCERPAAERPQTNIPPASAPVLPATVAPVAADSPAIIMPSDTLNAIVPDSAITDPRLDEADGVYMLHLPRAMDSALKALSPDFHTLPRTSYSADIRHFLPHHPLFAVVADFDGDGRPDVAMLGNVGLVAIFNVANASRAMCVTQCGSATSSDSRYQLDIYLELQPKGKVEIPDMDGGAPESVTVDHDGFQMIYFEKASELYYWSGGKWKSIVTGD